MCESLEPIDFRPGNSPPLGSKVNKLSFLFADVNIFYTKFIPYSKKIGSKIQEKSSLDGEMKVIDFTFKDIIARGRATNIRKVSSYDV